DLATVEATVDKAAVRHDRDGDQHYDVISAFIKSIRGSDVDAALHYLARMIEAGEDPRFIARRLVVHASEDIGMADPTALQTAVAAAHAVQFIGMPEGRLALAQATVHLATAPKSNAVISAIDGALADVRAGKAGSVPPHLRDGHYVGAARLGHPQGYRYPHNVAERGVRGCRRCVGGRPGGQRGQRAAALARRSLRRRRQARPRAGLPVPAQRCRRCGGAAASAGRAGGQGLLPPDRARSGAADRGADSTAPEDRARRTLTTKMPAAGWVAAGISGAGS